MRRGVAQECGEVVYVDRDGGVWADGGGRVGWSAALRDEACGVVGGERREGGEMRVVIRDRDDGCGEVRRSGDYGIKSGVGWHSEDYFSIQAFTRPY